MGLLYNNKKKTDLVVLSEEKLENNEGEAFDFELIPDEATTAESENNDEKES